MPGTPTTKYALPTMAGSDIGNTIDDWTVAFGAAVDGKLAPSDQGALVSRPVSTVGSPGRIGRTYFATDTVQLFRDNGTGWTEIALPPGAWQSLTLGSGISTGSPVAAARLEAGGTVRLRGYLLNSSGSSKTSGVTLATIPVGLRPVLAGFPFLAALSSGYVICTISGGGLVELDTGTIPNGNKIWIEGVTFQAT